ncbi:MAG: hypothetical protein SF053_21390 [Bacteroidia bacterium]|nr:hypothetical protein [Bacteroidia bacterium]
MSLSLFGTLGCLAIPEYQQVSLRYSYLGKHPAISGLNFKQNTGFPYLAISPPAKRIEMQDEEQESVSQLVIPQKLCKDDDPIKRRAKFAY